MKRTSIRRAVVPGIAVAALALGGCSAANEQPASGGGDGSDSGLSGTLSGGGASSQEAAQTAWRAGFQEANPGVQVNYDPAGSSAGREQFIAGGYPFAGSDAYLSDDEGELTGAQDRCGGDVVEVPNYVSPIAIIFNVDGVDELNLSPETLAGIFANEITSWDDPAIVADNPNASLPSADITAVHRSDGSGTTENFTNYLSTVAANAWTFGEVEEWPIKAGEGANGTSGVVSAVQNGTNTIGYADASQAGDLGKANVKVGSEFVGPTPEAAAKIFEVSPAAEGRADTSLVFDLDYQTEEAGTYPIVLTSYLIACSSYDDAEEGALVKGYLSYIVSDEGQQAAAENAGSAPLSGAVAEQARSIVDGIQVG